mgnify:CR=1 FL=1
MNQDLFVSKTTWGTIIAFSSLVATQLGYDIGDTEGWVILLTGGIGSGLAIYGRVKAVKKIATVGGLPIKGA